MVVKELSEVTPLYRQAFGFPTPTSGNLAFTNDNTTVTVQSLWSQRDIERKAKVTLSRSHVIDLTSGNVVSQSGPQEVNNEVWNKASPSGNFRAVVRSGKDKKNEDKQFLEIFDKTRKLKTVDILALGRHGKIIDDDGQFGSFEWSSSEGHLLYVAEKKKPKTESFFDAKEDDGGDRDSKDDLERGNEYEHRENWGEKLAERHLSVLCVMDVETAVVSVLDNVDPHLCPGQAMWTPDDAGVVFCAWDHEPYRLGLKHCCQRKGGLYYLDIQKGSVDLLSEEGRTVRFPRFSPDMSRLVYFDSPVGGAHLKCNRMVMVDWATRTRSSVVDIVRHAVASSFQGIYIGVLPRNVWFDDSVHLALSGPWRSVTRTVIINTSTGSVVPLSKGSSVESTALLGVQGQTLLLNTSSPSTPFHLTLARLQKAGDPSSAQWIYPDGTPEKLDWLSSWEVIQHTPTPDRVRASNEKLDYESILCLPKAEKDGSLPPLILFSHGGPHVSFDVSFSECVNFFCLCGYAVLQTNYRGSWGFGDDNLESLLGHIGDMDVKDMESAMMSVVMRGVVDGNRLMAFGGSHGGFLTTHLVGQYPETFKAASVRNPVINLTSMFGTTDIPDWVCAEGGVPFPMDALMDEAMFPDMWRRSPMAYVNQVKTPMLLLVGLKDLRVPPTQSIEYYKALKARHVPVRCLTYPSSNHSLAEVDVEGDSLMNTIMWYNAYI